MSLFFNEYFFPRKVVFINIDGGILGDNTDTFCMYV